MLTWRCVKQCGACCYLDPEERPYLAKYLTPPELELYLGLVGDDGWCVHFQQETRECRIYEYRPPFCRVKPDSFQERYGVPPEEFDQFAIDCCYQHIGDRYGSESKEMQQYQEQLQMEP